MQNEKTKPAFFTKESTIKGVRDFLTSSKTSPFIVMGCGNATFQFTLFEDGILSEKGVGYLCKTASPAQVVYCYVRSISGLGINLEREFINKTMSIHIPFSDIRFLSGQEILKIKTQNQ